jgi:hypothetical protein
MRTALITIAILLGFGFIAAAVALKPTGFERCVAIIGGDIDRQASRTGATLDPRDMEVEAARICAGQSQQ